MKQFTVTLVEAVVYTVEVEAENTDDAGELAIEMWVQSMNPTSDFRGMGEGVTIDGVQENEG